MEESEKEKIRQEARRILDGFASSLEKVKLKAKETKKSEGGFREEGKGNSCDKEFRASVFGNAPNKEGDFIIAEKKKW